jgi:hypothetical protein
MLVGMPYVTCTLRAGNKIDIDLASRSREGVTGPYVLRLVGRRVSRGGGRAGALALLFAAALAVTPPPPSG